LKEHLSWRVQRGRDTCAGCEQTRGEDTPMLTCSGCRAARFHHKMASKKIALGGSLATGNKSCRLSQRRQQRHNPGWAWRRHRNRELQRKGWRRLDEHDRTVPSACFAPQCGCRPPGGLTSSSSSSSSLCHRSGREEATAILNHECAFRRLVIKRAPLTRQGASGGASCATFARAHWHDACTVAHASR
jgi:hypothetical protein